MAILMTVLLGAVLAFAEPRMALWARPALQPAFTVTMFFVGTLVRPEQVRAFAVAPGRALSGLVVQYTIMPLCAAAISLFFDDPLIRTGILPVGCMPGAMH